MIFRALWKHRLNQAFGAHLSADQLNELARETTEWQAFCSLMPFRLPGGSTSRGEAIIEVQRRIERALAVKGETR